MSLIFALFVNFLVKFGEKVVIEIIENCLKQITLLLSTMNDKKKIYIFIPQFIFSRSLFCIRTTGDAAYSLLYHNNMMFTTMGRDNDKKPDGNCAQVYHGAWWYNVCHNSNLNGRYYSGSHSQTASGENWNTWKGHNYSLKKTEMKFRPASF